MITALSTGERIIGVAGSVIGGKLFVEIGGKPRLRQRAGPKCRSSSRPTTVTCGRCGEQQGRTDLAASVVDAAGPYLLVSGRWDNTVVVIDMMKAMEAAYDGTPARSSIAFA